jgi:hypothetical protein
MISKTVRKIEDLSQNYCKGSFALVLPRERLMSADLRKHYITRKPEQGRKSILDRPKKGETLSFQARMHIFSTLID